MIMRHILYRLLLPFALLACSDGIDITHPLLPETVVQRALDPSYGLRTFYLTGFSYGPEFEEYDEGSCQGLYDFVEDSVQVWSGTPPAYVQTTAYKRVGCSPGSYSDGPFVGGNFTYYISNSSVAGSVVADGGEDQWLYDVPKDPSGTLYLSAYANPGYTFLHWVVYPSSGGSYLVTSSSISRDLDSADWHFHAEFQKTS
jgi:hypothetical protein